MHEMSRSGALIDSAPEWAYDGSIRDTLCHSDIAGPSKNVIMASIEKIRQVQLVGRKIRELRKEHKLTQVELSSRLGIQQSDLSRMEKGEYRVSLDTLFRILAEFRMGVGEFFEDVAQETITPRDARIIQDLKDLPDDAQREVEDFIAFKRSQSERDN